eukprot:scaffold13173_cov78-Cyclotella_meneghiniana.AAC.10
MHPVFDSSARLLRGGIFSIFKGGRGGGGGGYSGGSGSSGRLLPYWFYRASRSSVNGGDDDDTIAVWVWIVLILIILSSIWYCYYRAKKSSTEQMQTKMQTQSVRLPRLGETSRTNSDFCRTLFVQDIPLMYNPHVRGR